MKIATALNGKKTLKMSRQEWENIGKKSGWKISQVIPSDGYADGGEPYTEDEMDLMESKKNNIPKEVYIDSNGNWAFKLTNMNYGTDIKSSIPWYEAQKKLKRIFIEELLNNEFAGDEEIRRIENLLFLAKIRA